MKQTYKFILVNPANINMDTLRAAIKDLPIRVIVCNNIENIKVVDSYIEVNSKYSICVYKTK